MLGPIYLIIVGIPSLLRASYARYYLKKNKTAWQKYYNGFPENWADRLSSKWSFK
jgi:hypothetical protein